MANKKKVEKLIIYDDVDVCDDIVYIMDIVKTNRRQIKTYLSKECDKLFGKHSLIYDRYITTLELILDNLLLVGEEFKIYSFNKHNEINFIIIIDGEVIDKQYIVDNYILNTCFGICIKCSNEYIYVDFDKYI